MRYAILLMLAGCGGAAFRSGADVTADDSGPPPSSEATPTAEGAADPPDAGPAPDVVQPTHDAGPAEAMASPDVERDATPPVEAGPPPPKLCCQTACGALPVPPPPNCGWSGATVGSACDVCMPGVGYCAGTVADCP